MKKDQPKKQKKQKIQQPQKSTSKSDQTELINREVNVEEEKLIDQMPKDKTEILNFLQDKEINILQIQNSFGSKLGLNTNKIVDNLKNNKMAKKIANETIKKFIPNLLTDDNSIFNFYLEEASKSNQKSDNNDDDDGETEDEIDEEYLEDEIDEDDDEVDDEEEEDDEEDEEIEDDEEDEEFDTELNLESVENFIKSNWNIYDKQQQKECIDEIKKIINSKRASLKNKTFNEDYLVLLFASGSGLYDLAQFILNSKTNIEQRSIKELTDALLEAASYGHADIVKLLLDHGAKIDGRYKENNDTALILASSNGHLLVVELLIKFVQNKYKQDKKLSIKQFIELYNDNGYTALMECAKSNQVEIAEVLIKYGANLEEINDEGYSALQISVRQQNEEMVALLLSKGANINYLNKETKETALTLAVESNLFEIVDYLIRADANIELGGFTPLQVACINGHKDLVDYLIECGANVNCKSLFSGETALHYAIDNPEIVKSLISANADLEAESSNGVTPLKKAIRAHKIDTVRILVEKGANIEKENSSSNNSQHKQQKNKSNNRKEIDPIHHKIHQQHMMLVNGENQLNDNQSINLCDKHAKDFKNEKTQRKLNQQHFKDNEQLLRSATYEKITKYFYQNKYNELSDDNKIIARLRSNQLKSNCKNESIVISKNETCLKLDRDELIDELRSKLNNEKALDLTEKQMQIFKDLQQVNREIQAKELAQKQQQQLKSASSIIAANKKKSNNQNLKTTKSESDIKKIESLKSSFQKNLPKLISLTESKNNCLFDNATNSATDHPNTTTTSEIDFTNSLSYIDFDKDFANEEFLKDSDCKTELINIDCDEEKKLLCNKKINKKLKNLLQTNRNLKADLTKTISSLSSDKNSHDSNCSIVSNKQQKELQKNLKDDDNNENSSNNNNQEDGNDELLNLFDTFEDNQNKFLKVLSKKFNIDNPLIARILCEYPSTSKSSASDQAIIIEEETEEESDDLENEEDEDDLDDDQDNDENEINIVDYSQSDDENLSDQDEYFIEENAGDHHFIQGSVLNLSYPSIEEMFKGQNILNIANLQSCCDNQDFEEDNNSIININNQQQQQFQLQIDKNTDNKNYASIYLCDRSTQTIISSSSSNGNFQLLNKPIRNEIINYIKVKPITKSKKNLNNASTQTNSIGECTLSVSSYIRKRSLNNSSNNVRRNSCCGNDEKYTDDTIEKLCNSLSNSSVNSFDNLYNELKSKAKNASPNSKNCDKQDIESSKLFEQLMRLNQFKNENSDKDIKKMFNQWALEVTSKNPLLTKLERITSSPSSSKDTVKTEMIINTSKKDNNSQGNKENASITSNEITQASLLLVENESKKNIKLTNKQATKLAKKLLQTCEPKSSQLKKEHLKNSKIFINGNEIDTSNQQSLRNHVRNIVKSKRTINQTTITEEHHTQISISSSSLSENKIDKRKLLESLPPDKYNQILNQINHSCFNNQNKNVSNQNPNNQNKRKNNSQDNYEQQTTSTTSNTNTITAQNKSDTNHDHPLTLACSEGNFELVKLLLDRGAKIEHRDKKGYTPLHWAASIGHLEIIDELVTKGADLEAEDKLGMTPLLVASWYGFEEGVEKLITWGSNVQAVDKKGHSILHCASKNNHFDVVKYLLNNYLDQLNLDTQDKKLQTALHFAVINSDLEIVNRLIECGASLKIKDKSERTCLHWASFKGFSGILDRLLLNKEEVDLNGRDVEGKSPLHLSCENGHKKCVALLLKSGADLYSTDNEGRTSLHLATMNNHHTTVQILIQKGAPVNAINGRQQTSLHIAAEHGFTETAKVLLSVGNIDITIAEKATGRTAFFIAASGGHVEIGRLLLNKGADINAQPVLSSKDTALTISADKGHREFVELLISYKAALDIKNKRGCSSLWLACNSGYLEVVKVLVEAGVDVDSQGYNRKVSCIMAAFRKGHVKVIKYLVKYITQFPSDNEMLRFIPTLEDVDLIKRCKNCMDIINEEKSKQADEANRAASILLEQLNLEQMQEEAKKIGKKLAATKKRERKKEKKKIEKELAKAEEEEEEEKKKSKKKKNKNKNAEKENNEKEEDTKSENIKTEDIKIEDSKKENIKKGNTKKEHNKKEDKCEKKQETVNVENKNKNEENNKKKSTVKKEQQIKEIEKKYVNNKENLKTTNNQSNKNKNETKKKKEPDSIVLIKEEKTTNKKQDIKSTNEPTNKNKKQNNEKTYGIKNLDLPTNAENNQLSTTQNSPNVDKSKTSPPKQHSKELEDDWKEVVRRQKKIIVPSNAISRVIGRAGCNIKLVREVSGAYIDIENQKNQPQTDTHKSYQGDRQIIIKGSNESTKIAYQLIQALINETEKDMNTILNDLGLSKSICASINEASAKTPNVSSSKTTITTTSVNSSACTKQATNAINQKSNNLKENQKYQNSSDTTSSANSSKNQSRKNSTNYQTDTDEQQQNSSQKSIWNSNDKSSSNESQTKKQETQNTTTTNYFSPFDSILSKVAQETIWSTKEAKPNFASVAASGLSTNNNSSLNNYLTNSDNSLNKTIKKTNEIKVDTLSKAPGYRGNLVLSPNYSYQQSNSGNSNTMFSLNNFGPIGAKSTPLSAPCTPPLSSTMISKQPTFQSTTQQQQNTAANQNSSLNVSNLVSAVRKDSLNTSKLLNSPTKSFNISNTSNNQFSTIKPNNSSFQNKNHPPTSTNLLQSISNDLITNELYSGNNSPSTMQLNTSFPLTTTNSQNNNFLSMQSSFPATSLNTNLSQTTTSNQPLNNNLQANKNCNSSLSASLRAALLAAGAQLQAVRYQQNNTFLQQKQLSQTNDLLSNQTNADKLRYLQIMQQQQHQQQQHQQPQQHNYQVYQNLRLQTNPRFNTNNQFQKLQTQHSTGNIVLNSNNSANFDSHQTAINTNKIPVVNFNSNAKYVQQLSSTSLNNQSSIPPPFANIQNPPPQVSLNSNQQQLFTNSSNKQTTDELLNEEKRLQRPILAIGTERAQRRVTTSDSNDLSNFNQWLSNDQDWLTNLNIQQQQPSPQINSSNLNQFNSLNTFNSQITNPSQLLNFDNSRLFNGLATNPLSEDEFWSNNPNDNLNSSVPASTKLPNWPQTDWNLND